MRLDPKKPVQVSKDGRLIFRQVAPGLWSVVRRTLPGFRLNCAPRDGEESES